MTKFKYYKFITYLIGAMEKTAEKDGGGSKREEVEKELRYREVYPINPVSLESFKTEMTSEEVTEKLKGWIAGGCWDKYREYADLIWKGKDSINEKGSLKHIPGDFDYVFMSDWITCVYNKGDSPCGTYGEAFLAYYLNKPIYLITDVPKKELRHSFLQAIVGSGGEVFDSLTQYLEFIDKTYKLKRKDSTVKKVEENKLEENQEENKNEKIK